MIKWGWSGLSHNAALTVYSENKVLFASESERYSGIKNDRLLNQELIDRALIFGMPNEVHFYENLNWKKTRQVYAKQYKKILNFNSEKKHLKQFGINLKPIISTHHKSHIASAYYTSTFNDALILCIDAIGEWNTISVWKGEGENITCLEKINYPHSVGLWYSALTQRIGLKPQEHEYILMGMASYGNKDRLKERVINDFFYELPSPNKLKLEVKSNLHSGCLDWAPELSSLNDLRDIAAAVQSIYEDIFENICCYLKSTYRNENLVISGGCALNCAANSLAYKYFDEVWIPPFPGDSGSSLGAILTNEKQHIDFKNNFWGEEIEGEYPIQKIIKELKENKVVGVANGCAEFGPRALGNRSLFADPRDKEIKSIVNNIKGRERFRPFAPIILEDYVDEYFEKPNKNFDGRFMQYAIKAIKSDIIPAVVHHDLTSRVQVVTKESHLNLYELLKVWYEYSGIPVLLNTSLNIKGRPIVNTEEDGNLWAKENGVKVFFRE